MTLRAIIGLLAQQLREITFPTRLGRQIHGGPIPDDFFNEAVKSYTESERLHDGTAGVEYGAIGFVHKFLQNFPFARLGQKRMVQALAEAEPLQIQQHQIRPTFLH